MSGTGLDRNQILAVLFDSTHVTDVNTDGSGNFSIQLAIPDTATGTSHQVCVSESNGNVCSAFTLEAASASSPSPTDTASPSPSSSPSGLGVAVATPSGGGSPLSLLIKPPFVFLPIIAAIALLAFLGLYLWRARPTPPIGEVTILHKSPPVRIYEAAPDVPAPAPAPAPAAPPVVYESPTGPAPPTPHTPPPAPPNGADIPPDLPEASD